MRNYSQLEDHWMPFTANRQFKSEPRLFESADGLYYRTEDGRPVLDGTSGLWCCNLGHNQPAVVQAIRDQAGKLDYAPSFQMGHPLSFEVAERLVQIAPNGFSRAFFTNSGSESVETALKMAIAYHRARGDASRTRLIGRERGYHGVNFGGTSVGGIVGNRKMFGTLLAGVDHIRHTHDPARNAFSRGQPVHGADLAEDLARLVALHDASTIAAVIVEPVAGSTGVLPPPVGYLERLRALCDAHGILLIFDEVITGFGRVGASFAAERFGVTPDIITTAKGITNGAVPMGAVLVREGVYDAIVSATAFNGIEFAHGYTYSAHPLACAAAIATLDVYRDQKLFDRVATLEPEWMDAIHGLADAPHVTDIRTMGLMAGIDLAPREGTPGARGYELFKRCFEAGLLVRATGDTIALSPPFTITGEEIAKLCAMIRAELEKVA